MTSPASTLSLARQVGASLGLTEGLDGSAALRMSPEDYAEYIHSTEAINKLSDERYSRYLAEFRALYLPSLLRTFLNNPIEAFAAIGLSLFPTFASLVGVHVLSADSYRFIREHPDGAVGLRAKALGLIADWSDSSRFVPDRVWTDPMKDLVLLYADLTNADCGGRDDGPRAGPDPLQVSADLKTRLQIGMKRLEKLQGGIKTRDSVPYAAALRDIRVAVIPGTNPLLRGTACIDRIVQEGKYLPWWMCEAKHPKRPDPQSVSACDGGSRDELRACARCLAVRYCSERHQKADWKHHKLTCVAPTW